MEYRLQIMYNHILGRTASVVSPFYSMLLGFHAIIWSLDTTIAIRHLARNKFEANFLTNKLEWFSLYFLSVRIRL